LLSLTLNYALNQTRGENKITFYWQDIKPAFNNQIPNISSGGFSPSVNLPDSQTIKFK
jgi:hypothetical protein